MTMKRRTKTIATLCIALSFSLGVLCTTFAAPGLALASATDCSENAGPMMMSDCERPSYLCGFDVGNNVFWRAITSPSSSGSIKKILSLAVDTLPLQSNTDIAPPGRHNWKNVSVAQRGKPSVYLFNSILNL